MNASLKSLRLAGLLVTAGLTLPCMGQEPSPKPAPSPAPQASQAPAPSPAPADPAPAPPTGSATQTTPAPASQPTPPAKAEQMDTTKTEATAPKPLLRGYIYPEIIKPKDMFYRGPGAGAGALFGAIGAAATANADHSAKGELIARMEKEHIDIAQILLEQVQAKFEATPGLEARIKAIDGVNLHVEIMFYGLVKTQLFSSTMYPTIRVRMTLNKEGQPGPVWTEKELVATAASENDKGFSYDEYMKDPEKIRIVWTNVSKIAVNRLLQSMSAKIPK